MIDVDGVIDLDNGEWVSATELLDDDERPDDPQKLYTTWDNSSVYARCCPRPAPSGPAVSPSTLWSAIRVVFSRAISSWQCEARTRTVWLSSIKPSSEGVRP